MLPPAALRVLALSTGRAAVSPQCCASPFSDSVTLEDLRREQAEFVAERDWAQFHTPRSLALALVGEVGELCETLQWRSDEGARPGLPGWTDDERVALEDELADVLSYVLRLADVAGVDLPAATQRKFAKNRAKYPAELVRGSSAKYSQYRRGVSLSEESTASVAEAGERAGGVGGGAEEGAAEGEGEKEWGQPQWVVDAYTRAQARAAAKWAALQAAADAPGAPPGVARGEVGAGREMLRACARVVRVSHIRRR
jgi:dCTP diphosphatase